MLTNNGSDITPTTTESDDGSGAELRADGLRCSTAARTIEYVAQQHGVITERRGWTLVSAAPVPRASAEQIGPIMALHGFAVTPTPAGEDHVHLSIDATSCPADTDPRAERSRLAEELAESAGAEAGDDWRARERAANTEYSWCMQQTLPFLRDRAARRPQEVATSSAPA